jgi:hypothetical protein
VQHTAPGARREVADWVTGEARHFAEFGGPRQHLSSNGSAGSPWRMRATNPRGTRIEKPVSAFGNNSLARSRNPSTPSSSSGSVTASRHSSCQRTGRFPEGFCWPAYCAQRVLAVIIAILTVGLAASH